MQALNKVELCGRLGQDPELRTSKNGLPWCSLSVATPRQKKAEDGTWREETDWHDVRVFRDVAEDCHRRLRKGGLVLVEGSLSYDVWTDDEGVRRRQTRVIARRCEPVGEPVLPRPPEQGPTIQPLG